MSADLRPLLEDALRELRRLRLERDDAIRAAREPIAIVGIGCRFPGGVSSPGELWRLLVDGVDAIAEPPAARVAAGTCPAPDSLGDGGARFGGFLDEVDRFDAGFFGISAREAAGIDPQQRLLLEVAWEALEDACIAPERVAGSRTGVFVGLFMDDYARLGFRSGDLERVDGHATLGSLRGMAAGRLAYALDAGGPAMQLDTACSSSLLAVHLACQSLRARECDLAIAGGANLMLTPEATLGVERLGALAPDGRCKAFSARADGFGRGEGCGVVVLARLSDALAARDRIVAVVRGSAANHDGRSNGLTAPNGPSQERVLRDALARAGVDPLEVGYVEAHGTGTPLGDPIEASAIAAVYGEGRDPAAPLLIGSIKSNVGHLEAAAGIAALAKASLALERGEIPPSLHAERPSERVPWDRVPLRVATGRMPWPAHARAAGVSAFGMTGTNVHVVLEPAPPAAVERSAAADRPAHVLALSARTGRALGALAVEYAAALSARPELDLADACYSANVGRARFSKRLAAVASTREELAETLRRFAAGEHAWGLATGEVAWGARPKIAFLFSGQGSQYGGMARELYDTQPGFRETLDRCASVLDGELAAPLLDVLFEKGGTRIDETEFTQPALFAVEYALAGLWRSWGVEPALLLGHSVGEYVAACVAGAIELEDALRLVAARGRLMQSCPTGAMTCVFAAEAVVRAELERVGPEVAIAAVNGDANVVISGTSDAVAAAVERFAGAGVRSKPLAVSHAFHSPMMEPILEELGRIAGAVTFSAPTVPVLSNVTGDVAGPSFMTPEYWVAQLRETVRFGAALARARELGCDAYLEVGPGSSLASLARQADPVALCLTSIGRRASDSRRMLEGLGQLFVRGAAVDWERFDAGRGRSKVALPTYPFERERHWLEARPAFAVGARNQSSAVFDAVVRSPLLDRVVFEVALSTERRPSLGDHRVDGVAVVPAAWYLASVATAAREAWGGTGVVLEDVVFERALVVEDGAERMVQLAIPRAESGSFEIVATPGEEGAEWSTYASGRVQRAGEDSVATGDLAAVRSRLATEAATKPPGAGEWLQIGPAYDWTRTVGRGDAETLAELERPERAHADPRDAAAGLLDSCMRTLALALDDRGARLLPFRVARATFRGSFEGRRFTCHARATSARSGDVTIYDEAGREIAAIEGLEVREAEGSRRAARGRLYEVAWRAVGRREAPRVGRVLIVGEGDEVAAGLRSLGVDATAIELGGLGDALRGAEGGVEVVSLAASSDRPEDAVVRAAGLISTLASAAPGREVRFWLATTGAQATGPDDGVPGLASAPLLGLGRVLDAEHPELRSVRVDLDPSGSAASNLSLAFSAPALERELAVRGGMLFAPRLRRASGRARTSIRFRSGGAYVVTGGLGGVGLAIAGWLAERGAGRVVLAGRSDPTEVARSAVAAIEAKGASAVFVQADVADPRDVERLLAEAATEGFELRGIVHAAGVIEDSILLRLRAESVARVLAPKVAGATNLDAATRGLSLDCFVLVSSAASLLGSAGQGAYAAANAFLDALAHHRRSTGLAGVSVNFGPWEGAGMASRLGERERGRWSERGVAPLAAGRALELLEEALAIGVPRVAALDVDWERFAGALAAPSSFLEELSGAAAAPIEALARELERLDDAERARALVDLVRARAARALSLDSPRAVPTGRSLFELGLDSLAALELRSELGAALGLSLVSTLVFDHPTVEALARHLGEIAFESGAVVQASVPKPLAPEELDRLGESEAEALLLEELDRLNF